MSWPNYNFWYYVRFAIQTALPGAGDGVTQLGYTQKHNDTFLIADSNDDGVLNDDDFVVQFQGLHNFTVEDVANTEFVIVGTNGDDVIIGTENDDRIFAAGGNDQVFALGGTDEVHGGTGDDFLDGGPGGFDNLFGEAGNDTLTLATSDVGGVASGGEGNDTLFDRVGKGASLHSASLAPRLLRPDRVHGRFRFGRHQSAALL
jgi:hypothetical protein